MNFMIILLLHLYNIVFRTCTASVILIIIKMIMLYVGDNIIFNKRFSLIHRFHSIYTTESISIIL